MNLYGVPQDWSEKLHPNGKKLWDEFQRFKYRLIVDNHSPWERFAKDEAYSDVAFVLGTTVMNERDKLLTLFENHHGHRKDFPNVFFFLAEIDDITEQGYLLKGTVSLERLDRGAVSVADKTKLASVGSILSPIGFSRPKEEPDEELERLTALRQHGQVALRREIEAKTPKCFRNYRLSTEVARMSLALLLEKEPAAQRTFDRKGSANSFSDAGLIRDALFLKTWVWSEDGGARKMASFCNVRAVREITRAVFAGFP
ncbi:MAG: hypothetical protein KBH45_13160 [Verrucomicrobia bacterium]|nr:hypothetical protein [Verrucomicrobiota bacterium]